MLSFRKCLLYVSCGMFLAFAIGLGCPSSCVAVNISFNGRMFQDRDVEDKPENAEIQRLKNLLESSDSKTRSQAVSKILYYKDKRIVPLLVLLLRDGNSHTRSEAIYALARLDAKEAANDVLKLVDDPESEVWHAAAEYGSVLGGRSDLETINRFLERPDFTSQSAAMHLTRNLPQVEAAAILGTFLKHQSHHLRKRALQSLVKFDAEFLSPIAIDILKLAGDSDNWVRSAARPYEKRLLKLVTVDELRKLTQEDALELQKLAYRMLVKKGAGVKDELSHWLLSDSPEERLAALELLVQSGGCSERQFVKMLNDPDEEVWEKALYLARRSPFKSMAPRLREIMSNTNDGDRRGYAASILMSLGEPIWPKGTPPSVTGYLYEPAARLVNGNEGAWDRMSKTICELMDGVSSMEAFPCDSKQLPKLRSLERLPVIKNAVGRLTGRRCFGVSRPVSADRSLVVIHGNLTIDGSLNGSVVVVTGDVYLHDGTVRNSVVLVQGRFICDGYISNSIVVVGEDEPLNIEDSYIMKSVVAAGTLFCDGYMSESVFAAGLPTQDASGRPFREELDIRNSSTFDSEAVYQYLRESTVESNR